MWANDKSLDDGYMSVHMMLIHKIYVLTSHIQIVLYQ